MRSAALLPILLGAAASADAVLFLSAALLLAFLLAFLDADLLAEAAVFLAALVFFEALVLLEALFPFEAVGFLEAVARLPMVLAAVPDDVRFVRLSVFARGYLTFQSAF
jgi:hypothetical protein